MPPISSWMMFSALSASAIFAQNIDELEQAFFKERVYGFSFACGIGKELTETEHSG